MRILSPNTPTPLPQGAGGEYRLVTPPKKCYGRCYGRYCDGYAGATHVKRLPIR